MLKFDGKALERKRKGRGLSRAELAEEAALGRNTIRDLEQGVSTPSGDTLTKLAMVLGCSLDELHADIENTQPVDFRPGDTHEDLEPPFGDSDPPNPEANDAA